MTDADETGSRQRRRHSQATSGDQHEGAPALSVRMALRDSIGVSNVIEWNRAATAEAIVEIYLTSGMYAATER